MTLGCGTLTFQFHLQSVEIYSFISSIERKAQRSLLIKIFAFFVFVSKIMIQTVETKRYFCLVPLLCLDKLGRCSDKRQCYA